MIDLMVLSLGLSLIVYGIYKWATLNDDYFVKRNVAHLKPSFLVGNTGGLFMKQYRPNEFFQNLYNTFPSDKIFGLFDFRQPLLFVRDPEILRQIAIKDFDHFEDHKFFVEDGLDTLFGKSLIMLRGEKWRDMRATLSPAFTGSKMRQMFALVGDCAFDMCEYFKRQSNAGATLNFEMKDMFSKYTNDVIATSAFGITVNSFENATNEFFVTGKRVLDFSSIKMGVKVLTMRIAPWIMKAINVQLIDAPGIKFFKSLVLDTINMRDKQNIFRPDMIQLLMQVQKGKTAAVSNVKQQIEDNADNDGFATVEESNIGKAVVKRDWSDDEIVAQCFLFFVAGFETSSSLLSFASYELALNPHIQNKLFAEIQMVNEQLQGKRIPYDQLQKMKYLDMVISETLRLWPPALLTDRVCVKNYDYNDGVAKFAIEKGTTLWIPIYAYHRDGQHFVNPDQFDPERFSDEQKNSITPGTYLPFGIGPRNCIGSRFALMEVKAVIYYMLLNFKFVTNAKTQIPLKLKKNPNNLAAEQGIHLEMKLRI